MTGLSHKRAKSDSSPDAKASSRQPKRQKHNPNASPDVQASEKKRPKQDISVADVERYDYDAAVASAPEGMVAPPRHFTSSKWNHYYFSEKDVNVNDPDSFKTATHVHCKHGCGSFCRQIKVGCRRGLPKRHSCWSSDNEVVPFEVQPVPQEQNLPVSGLKADLIQRLEENEVVVDEQLLQSVKKNTPKKKSAPKKKMLASKPVQPPTAINTYFQLQDYVIVLLIDI